MTEEHKEESLDSVNHELGKPVEEKTGNPIIMIILSIVFLVGGAFAMKSLMETKPEAKKSVLESWVPSVRVMTAELTDYTPVISAEGSVMASTKTMLISEVSGAITFISSQLEKGNTISKGEILIKVDDANYQTELTNSKSSLADAELLLAQEKAKAMQAEREWSKLGRGGLASDLMLRKPQIKSANAKIEAAQAMITKAERDVRKTIIRVPYTCMVDQKFIDAGAFVSSMSQIAEVSAIDQYEVRLPLNLNELGYLTENSGMSSEVMLNANIGGKVYQWIGKAERFEGGIDSATFSRIMVVSVKRDDSQDKGYELPPVGLFLKADFTGSPMGEVFSIPREAFREDDKLWVLSKENTLKIIDVKIIRAEKEVMIVDVDSLKVGDRIINSPIAIPVNGMQLEIDTEGAK